MADLTEVVESSRSGNSSLRYNDERNHRNTARRNSSSGSEVSFQTSSRRYDIPAPHWNDMGQQPDERRESGAFTPGDHQAEFYKEYHRLAEEYDKDFLKKHDEDLNTTLIFAGLFSAVTSAFIIQILPQLQPDSGDETVALLRVLLYKIDDTAFGNDVPALPQWTGPPRAIVQVQAILLASLSASLFSAFLAMLGKQWLNRYDSTEMRGTAIDRSQNRQRKLDGVVTWYFEYVMELLPLMLQAALLLLGCALSRYLWETNIVIASVVIGVTSFGVIFYLFVIVAGTASESFPYQTPGAHALRHLLPLVYSASSKLFRTSWLHGLLVAWRNQLGPPRYSVKNIVVCIAHLAVTPTALVFDSCTLVVLLPLAVARTTCRRFIRTFSPPTRGPDQQPLLRDSRCVSWILQTSLQKTVHLSAFKYLMTLPEVGYSDSALVAGCFNAFINCFSVNVDKVVIVQGLEELATLSSRCFIRSFLRLSDTDPTSSTLVDLRKDYNKVFPLQVDFGDLSFRYTMVATHILAGRGEHFHIRWEDIRPSIHEHVLLAQCIAESARRGYSLSIKDRRVPDWTLDFAAYYLSLDPPPPLSIVADCLRIIAIDLGCDPSNNRTFDESARVERVSSLVTQKLDMIVEAPDRPWIYSKHRAIRSLLPYAVSLEQGGQPEMIEGILRAARATGYGDFVSEPNITRLFHARGSPFLDQVIILLAPQICWESDAMSHNPYAVTRWAAAVSAVTYTEEVGQSAVHTLLHIASNNSLRHYIPTETWALLNKRPHLPPLCPGQSTGTAREVVLYIRGLGELKILKSYFLLIWSEWSSPHDDSVGEMKNSIREDFGGVRMKRHRRDLIKRLDAVLGQLGRGLKHFQQHDPLIKTDEIERRKKIYGRLKGTLLEVEGRQ